MQVKILPNGKKKIKKIKAWLDFKSLKVARKAYYRRSLYKSDMVCKTYYIFARVFHLHKWTGNNEFKETWTLTDQL